MDAQDNILHLELQRNLRMKLSWNETKYLEQGRAACRLMITYQTGSEFMQGRKNKELSLK